MEPTVEHVSELIVTTSLLTAKDRSGLTYENIETRGEIERHRGNRDSFVNNKIPLRSATKIPAIEQ